MEENNNIQQPTKIEDNPNYIHKKLCAMEAYKRTCKSVTLSYILLFFPLTIVCVAVINRFWAIPLLGISLAVGAFNVVSNTNELKRLESAYNLPTTLYTKIGAKINK